MNIHSKGLLLVSIRPLPAWMVVVGFILALNAAAIAQDGSGDKVETSTPAESPVSLAIRGLAQGTTVAVMQGTDVVRDVPLRPEPLLRYGDRTRDIGSSALWVWMDGELPVVFQKIEINDWSPNYPQWTFCVGCASPETLTVNWSVNGGKFLPLPVAALELPGAPMPAENGDRRSLELRALARDLNVTSTVGKKSSELRLMPKPLMEFADKTRGIAYAAVVAYALGTNPDFLVVIQLREQEGTAARWSCIPIHMTSAGLQLKYKEELIWEDAAQNQSGLFEHWGYFFTPRAPSLK